MRVHKLIFAIATLLLLALAPGAKAQEPPKVINSPAIVIDAASGEGRTLVYVKNPRQDASVKVALSGSLTAPKAIDATLRLAAEQDTGEGAPVYEAEIPAGGVLKVAVVVRKMWDAGDFEADLTNDGTSLKKIRISRPALNVKLDGPTPDKADIALANGRVTSLPLRNDDATPYRFNWKLWVNGAETCAGNVSLAAKGVDLVKCTPNLDRFGSSVRDAFKSETSEGNILALYPEGGGENAATALKTFPVKASLSNFSPGVQQSLSYLTIVVILILGGLTSLFLSQALPNRLQRLKLEEQIDGLAKSTADLSSHVDSKLQVLLRLERSRLRDLLFSRKTWSPDFQSISATCSQGFTRLSSRITLTEQMDVILRRLANLLPSGIPPQQIDQVGSHVGAAAVLVGKSSPSDKDLESAQANITSAAALIERMNQPDEAFGKQLAERALPLKADIEANFRAKNVAFDRIVQAVPGPVDVLKRVPDAATEIAAASYIEVDMATQKMSLIRDYAILAENAKNNPDALKRLTDHEPDLISRLLTNSLHGLSAARLLIREMKDDVYAERIGEMLNENDAFIDIDPKIAYAGAPLELCARFRNDALNSAAAREEWICSWDFGDDLKETGWTVSHYFQFAKPKYPISARFQQKTSGTSTDSSGKPLQLTKDLEVRARANRSLLEGRTWAEGLKLAAALLIAVFGMVAGAREELTKLDILPGLVAVFLVGFGADTIKNLLTSKS